jgi:hypothetical protein
VDLSIRHADPRGPARQLTRGLSERRIVGIPHPPPNHASPLSEPSPRFSHTPSAALPKPAKPLPPRHSRSAAIRAPLIAIRVGKCPEQWPGTTQSPSWATLPSTETTQHVRPRAALAIVACPTGTSGRGTSATSNRPADGISAWSGLHGIEGRKNRIARPCVARRDCRQTARAGDPGETFSLTRVSMARSRAEQK